MTDQDLDDLIAYDTQRWMREGIPQDLINSRNAGTRRFYRELKSPFAQAAARLANKISGKAPGTAIDATPIVIEGQAVSGKCQTCEGFEWITNHAGEIVPCTDCGADERIAARRAASVDGHSSQNGRASEQTFATFEIPKSLALRDRLSLQECHDAVLKFASNPDGWVVIHGPPGNGKSHLAAAAYNSLKRRAKPTIFITAPEMLKSLTDLFNQSQANKEDTSYGQRLETFKSVPVLILDDLGAHHEGKGWAQGVLFEVFDYRYRNRLPTIVTMNISPDDPSLGERIADRLHDTHDGFATIYHNTAPTHRRL